MSCAELIYHHPQPLSSTFPYHHHHGSQRSIAGDVYCNSSSSSSSSNYNNSSICSDYNGQVENEASEDSTNTRMLHPLARQTSSSTAPPPLQSSNFASRSASSSSSSPPSSLGLLPHLPPPRPQPPPLPHVSVTPPISQHLSRGSSLASGSLALCGVGGGGGGRETQPQAPPPPSLNAALSSSPSSTSPLLTPSPSLSYFPPPISSSSAFTSRAHTHGSSDPFLPAPVSSLFFPPPPSSSLSPASSYCSSTLKRRSSEAEEAEDVPVPKKTRYVTSNCVMLTYHERDTSSEVDDHFSRALSSPGSSSSCGYGSGGTSRHSSTAEPPPMSQRNFPPSFWDATHYLRQHHYHHHYNAAAMAGYNYPHQTATFTPHGAATASQTAGLFAGGGPHDPLYPLASPFLSGSLAMSSPFHTSFSSLHKDPWAGFPFSSGSKSSALNYYRYPRAGAYPDPHSAFSTSYGSSSSAVTEGSSSGRFSSSASYGSLFLPSAASSMRGSGGYFSPSATITSAQSGGGGELGSRMTPQGRETSRGFFAGSGSLSGPDSSAHEAGKDFHWY